MGAETPFFQTRMGHTFYNATMPRIAKALERIAEALEAQKATATPESVAAQARQARAVVDALTETLRHEEGDEKP